VLRGANEVATVGTSHRKLNHKTFITKDTRSGTPPNEVSDTLCRLGDTKRSRRATEEPNLNRRRNMTDRQNMIERMVEQYRDDLDEKDDDELLGGTLDTLREHTIERMTERYQAELEEELKCKMETYQDELEEQSNEDLLGNTLEDVREDTIERLVEQHQQELEGKSDEELFGENPDDSEQ
jgi:hypothetical protein